MFTLHPRFFSNTFFTTYVLAVDPAHACSLIVTVPHAFDPAAAPPVNATATKTAATIIPPTRTFIPCPPLYSRQVLEPPAAASSRDPVEDDPECQDRERREHALSE